MELVPYLDPEIGLKLIDGDHIDRVPRHAVTDAGADLAADALVPPDPDRGDDRPGGLRRWFMIDAVHGAERDAGLTSGAGVVDDGHEARPLFLDGLLVVVGDFLVQGVLSSVIGRPVSVIIS